MRGDADVSEEAEYLAELRWEWHDNICCSCNVLSISMPLASCKYEQRIRFWCYEREVGSVIICLTSNKR